MTAGSVSVFGTNEVFADGQRPYSRVLGTAYELEVSDRMNCYWRGMALPYSSDDGRGARPTFFLLGLRSYANLF